ncbi:MAG: HAD family hydrolase [Planctomycetota bacterium]|jgi:FMN phosphatase YigB (HAD superfamily)
MNVQGIFFDLFGTLLIYGDMEAAWRAWMRAFHRGLRTAGLPLSEEEFSSACSGFFSKPEPSPPRPGKTVLEMRVLDFCEDLGLALSPRDLESTVDGFVDAWQGHITLDPDAPRVLSALQGRLKVCLVSNFDHPPHIDRLLSSLELVEYFDALVVSGTVGVKKPDPAIFAIACRRTRLDPRQVIHVGDAPEDVEGALASGIRPVLIERKRVRRVMTDYVPEEDRDGERPVIPAVEGDVHRISRLTVLLEMLGIDPGNSGVDSASKGE